MMLAAGYQLEIGLAPLIETADAENMVQPRVARTNKSDDRLPFTVLVSQLQ